ncbi:NAD(P)/FAD-dependent oxidoreductase [Streptomyces sp. NPDC058045]|uniref:NAD(P)/FAD-dependent oxidoreductase n=1 Tax=Streptomyces sp. NPDC058045 TaxID=3346311 RepID=UPI0036E31BAE
MDSRHDVVVVGGGAAGLTAGIVLARAQAEVLLVDAGRPRNAPAAAMHGFVSRDGMSPLEFQRTGKEEFARYGGTLAEGRVEDAVRQPNGSFQLRLSHGSLAGARAVLVATGLTDELPELPGVRELWGESVHHCPHCHGYEVRGQEIVVLGGRMPPISLHHAGLLRRYSDRVTLCPNGMEVPDTELRRLSAHGVRIADGKATGLATDEGRLVGVELAGGGRLDCAAVFIAPRPRPNDGTLRALGCATDPGTGWVRVDAAGATSVPGVWAAGNVVDPRAQVITAAGAASAAAIAVVGRLLEQDLAAADAR